MNRQSVQQQTYLLIEGGLYMVSGNKLIEVGSGFLYDRKPLFINTRNNLEASIMFDTLKTSITLKEIIKAVGNYGITTYISEELAGDIIFKGILKKLSLIHHNVYNNIFFMLSMFRKIPSMKMRINNCEVNMVCEYYLTFYDKPKYKPIFYDEIIKIQKTGDNIYTITTHNENYTLMITNDIGGKDLIEEPEYLQSC